MSSIKYIIGKIISKLPIGGGYKVMHKYFINSGITIDPSSRCYSDIATPESYLISIGKNVTISTNVSFITHDNSAEKLRCGVSDLFGRIKVGDNCFIGANSTILLGVNIGNNCIVGAGAVVTKSIPPNSIVGGNPARIISSIDKYKNFVIENGFSIEGLNRRQKKELLLDNKLIKK